MLLKKTYSQNSFLVSVIASSFLSRKISFPIVIFPFQIGKCLSLKGMIVISCSYMIALLTVDGILLSDVIFFHSSMQNFIWSIWTFLSDKKLSSEFVCRAILGCSKNVCWCLNRVCQSLFVSDMSLKIYGRSPKKQGRVVLKMFTYICDSAQGQYAPRVEEVSWYSNNIVTWLNLHISLSQFYVDWIWFWVSFFLWMYLLQGRFIETQRTILCRACNLMLNVLILCDKFL